MPLPMVLATAVPKTKAAIKFQKAAHRTARKGVSTRVETTVAMELAASCQPFENSKARVRKMTTKRSEKLDKGTSPAWERIEERSLDCAARHFRRSESGRKNRAASPGMTLSLAYPRQESRGGKGGKEQ